MTRYGNILYGGDPAPQTGGESTDEQMAALIKNLPALTKVTGENILPFEQAKQSAANAISPQENQLALDLYKQFGPALNAVGNQIAGQNQIAGVNNDAAALAASKQSGLVDNALALQRQADPEFYATREKVAAQQSKLMDAMGTGALSPTEIEQISRGLNRTNVAGGVNDIGSPTAAVTNAMNFGSAGTAKQNSISQALASTANSLGSMKSGFDPFQVATGRSAFNNAGAQQFQGPSQGIGQSTVGMSNSLLDQAGQNQRLSQTINSQRRDSLDRFNTTFGSVMNGIGSVAGGACCFIFLESCDGQLPYTVRKYRDLYYNTEPDIADGYKKMAGWLVPMMVKFGFVKSLVQELMTKPMVQYGLYLEGLSTNGSQYKTANNFWLKAWKLIGKWA